MHPLFPSNNQAPAASATAPPASVDGRPPPFMDSYVGSVLDTSTSSSNSTNSSIHEESYTGGASTSNTANGSKSKIPDDDPPGNPAQHFQSQSTVPSVIQTTLGNTSSDSVPSAPPAAVDVGPVHYPSVDMSPLDSSSPPAASGGAHEEGPASSCCTICLDAPVEGACIPCGHMVGCMSCLNEIKAKKWGCPLCRSGIDQVIRIYAV